MRTIWISLGIIMLTGIASAQYVVPGTFSTPIQAVPFAPVLSPPYATLGSELTPTVVTNSPLFFTGDGQWNALGYSATGASESTVKATPRQSPAGARTRNFDFVVADAGSSSTATDQSQSLADVARTTRKDGAPIAGRKITNQDINQMNQKYGTPPASQPAQPAPVAPTPR